MKNVCYKINKENLRKPNIRLLFIFVLFILTDSCTSTKSFLALPEETPEIQPQISNPFGTNNQINKNETTKVRSRVGDQFTEIELPKNEGVIDTYNLPSIPSSDGNYSGGYSNSENSFEKNSDLEKQSPTQSDYEILSKIKVNNREQDAEKRDIERTLGVKTLESEAPQMRKSLLTQIDFIKQLFKAARYEHALSKVDQLLEDAPTLPLLYQMRGTLLEKIGHSDLALQSWKQALRLEPTNDRLKKLISRRERIMTGNRMPASELGGAK